MISTSHAILTIASSQAGEPFIKKAQGFLILRFFMEWYDSIFTNQSV